MVQFPFFLQKYSPPPYQLPRRATMPPPQILLSPSAFTGHLVKFLRRFAKIFRTCCQKFCDVLSNFLAVLSVARTMEKTFAPSFLHHFCSTHNTHRTIIYSQAWRGGALAFSEIDDFQRLSFGPNPSPSIILCTFVAVKALVKEIPQ